MPCEYLRSLCNSKFGSRDTLETHIGEVHEHKCDICDLTFKSKEKLHTHICRIDLKDPENDNLYMKNWIVSNSCSIVFCKRKLKEVSILHTEACLNSCQDLPGWFCKGDEPLQDNFGTYHLRLDHCIQNGEVNWSNIITEET